MVECIDGSNKYPSITAREDADRKLKATYDYWPNLLMVFQLSDTYINYLGSAILQSIMYAIWTIWCMYVHEYTHKDFS